MNFPRLSILLGTFGRRGFGAFRRAKRWSEARIACPELADDVAELGGLLQMPMALAPDPVSPGAHVDPCRLSFEAGQRDLAVKILALMGVTVSELNQLMEANDED